jgi:acetyl esterase
MTVNPSEQAFFDDLEKELQENQPKPLDQLTLDEYREQAANFINFSGAPADVASTDFFVPARDGHQIHVRLYDPCPNDVGPIFIMYPGCGYVCDLYEVNCISASRIAHYSQIKVAMVEFRLAPEWLLPQAIYDGYDATRYLAEHAATYRIDPAKIIIGGLSSGASCAASVAQLARKDDVLHIRHQILLNGCYDFTDSQAAYREYEEKDFLLNRESIEHIFSLLGRGGVDLSDPLISPIFNQDLSGMAPTTMMIGEYDGLRSSSETYYQCLKQAGNEVGHLLLKGQTHNTLVMMAVLSQEEDVAITLAQVIEQVVSNTKAF